VELEIKMNYVLGFCFNNELTMVVLIRKTHPDWQAGKLNGVGGLVELGESPIEAMIREFKEETGVITNREDWYNFANKTWPDGSLTCFSCIDSWLFEKVKTTTEEVVGTFKIDQLLECQMVRDTYSLIQNVLRMK
jgi:8-oxo-dGTP diphosphatase